VKTILHLFKVYKGNQSLLNDIVNSGGDGHRSIACFLGGDDDGFNNMYNSADMVVYLGGDRRKIKWSNIKIVKDLKKLIEDEGVDLVICHTWRPMAIGVLTKYLSKSRPKVVGIFHGVRTGAVTFSKKILFRIVFSGMDKIVGVSNACVEDIANYFWSVDKRKLVSIPNGIDCEPFLAVDPQNKEEVFTADCKNKFVFIAVSRLAAVKNLERFILAFHKLIQVNDKAVFVIVGAGPLEEKLKALVQKKELFNHVFFVGFKNNVPNLLKSADVFVMPSLREGLSRSLLEAMVSEKPVLASNIDSISEVVDDYVHGRLVNPEDVEDILGALLFVIGSDNKALKAMGLSAKKRVLEKYTSEIMQKNYFDLFSSML